MRTATAARDIRFVVSDVDGTIVDHDKRLRPATIEAVARVRAAGIGFTVISARPPSGPARTQSWRRSPPSPSPLSGRSLGPAMNPSSDIDM